MPNWVSNRILADGIDKMPIYTTGEDGTKDFDFNVMIPMPGSLDVTAGGNEDESLLYFLTDRLSKPADEYPDRIIELLSRSCNCLFMIPKEFFKEIYSRTSNWIDQHSKYDADRLYESGQQYFSNYARYGSADWYGWCCENWGTKWNACDTVVRENEVLFETAWSAPIPVLKKLSSMFPDVKFEHWFADEDIGNNSGYIVYIGGKIVDGGYHDACSPDAYATYAMLNPGSLCVYQDSRGEWHMHECNGCCDECGSDEETA